VGRPGRLVQLARRGLPQTALRPGGVRSGDNRRRRRSHRRDG